MGCKELSIESYYRFSEPGEKSYMRPSDCEEKTAYIAIFREAIVDNYNLIAVFDQNDNLLKSCLWGADLSGTLHGAGGVGGLLAVTDHTESKTYLSCMDGNGNVVGYVDVSDGSEAASFEYDPFGKTISKSGPKADDFKFKFSSKPQDPVTGMYDFGKRPYMPEIGRFPTRDPIGILGGNNPYRYTNNDAINKIDILGLYPGTPGHGDIISPEDSVRLVAGIQNAADAEIDRVIKDSFFAFRKFRSTFRNGVRLASYHWAIGTDEHNKFVYTCKYGWIDHGHFFNNAGLVYTMSRFDAWILSGINELLQQSVNSGSRWTPEDLISNKLGRDLGQKAFWHDVKGIAAYQAVNPFNPIPKGMFYNIAHHWMMLLKKSGAVRWNERTKGLLEQDLKDFQANPRNDIYTVKMSREYYENTDTWKCLCDGDKPKNREDQY